MDIHMPRMDGYEATRKIMEVHPVPIVIVSSTMDAKSVEKTFRALQAGALASLAKPEWLGRPESNRMAAEIIETLKLMSEVKVVKRRARLKKKEAAARRRERMAARPAGRIELVAIGASTGGPPAIHTILSHLSRNIAFPILVVQHIASGFLQGMTDWLHRETAFPVRIPAHGERLVGGEVYFAPEGHHMGVTGKGKICLSKAPQENGMRPSISHLFRSVGNAYGRRAVGILLTGMGKDGALELGRMREKGAVTVAQDKESCVVHGMPGEAIRLDAAQHVFPPEEIAAFLSSLVKTD
jgi:two-component system chemotaxis response regulator CheB